MCILIAYILYIFTRDARFTNASFKALYTYIGRIDYIAVHPFENYSRHFYCIQYSIYFGDSGVWQ
jgi:hypothetical protein